MGPNRQNQTKISKTRITIPPCLLPCQPPSSVADEAQNSSHNSFFHALSEYFININIDFPRSKIKFAISLRSPSSTVGSTPIFGLLLVHH
ncbi:hypothetical protein ES332_A07G232300v1 [Gossypium tomentosum]|uniref:Uncharacterized protein n=1 Tax=Gossypium tomentosum TaxID=34277 RepID=A0A5D2PZ67_GOSTO|nr:hypothetical protein ES332_A07G232300v1 [Gossypium tomentosum]